MDETRSSGPKALLISFILHIAVLGLFAFTFTLRPNPEKPSFVFLGSILKDHDLLTHEEDAANHLPQIPVKPVTNIGFIKNNALPQKTSSIEKPFHSQGVVAGSKKYFKTSLDEDVPAPQEPKTPDSQTPKTLTPLSPLRLEHP